MVKSILIQGLLLAISLVGCAGDVAGEEVDFDVLIAMAERYELPQPPKDAPLVLANTGSTTYTGIAGSSDDPGDYAPAFLLKRLPAGKARVLIGWNDRVAETNAYFRPATRRFSLMPPEWKPKGYRFRYENTAALITAVHLAQRGERFKATTLWNLVESAVLLNTIGDLGGMREWTDGKLVTSPPRTMFAHCLFQYLYDAALRRNADIKDIRSKLVLMQQEFPGLFSEERGYDTHRRWLFVEDLKWNVWAKKPPKDSVEALLIEWSYRGNIHNQLWGKIFVAGVTDKPADTICNRGIVAIPELMKLSDDRRVTPRQNGSPEWQARLGSLARDLLAMMLGSQDLSIVAAHLEKKDGDRLFFEKAAVEMQDGKLVHYHQTPLEILATRHPHSLITFCKTIPAKPMPKVYPFTLGGVVLRSKLTAQEKRQAILAMCDRLEEHSPDKMPLWSLVQVDQQRCISYIQPKLVKMAQGTKEPKLHQRSLPHGWLVMRLQHDGIWKVFLAVVNRSRANLRMQTIHEFDNEETLKNNRQRLLAFLAAFLDDHERHDPSVDAVIFSWAHSEYTLGKIAVADFATAKIAKILGFDERPAKSWTDEQWAELGTKVKAALKKENLPVLED